mmetsp:Transcript_921/g.1689  ORF Transcript_921/g.1689 Transcript_921/m.1689 type:complete len:107 (-) Transcript_921:1512-1832(-)
MDVIGFNLCDYALRVFRFSEARLREQNCMDSASINWVLDRFGKSISTTTEETDLATITMTERCIDSVAFLASVSPSSSSADGEQEDKSSHMAAPDGVPAALCIRAA